MKHLTLFAGALLALTAPAAAQWSDNFDSYPSNTVLQNVGGWFGWDNLPAAAGTAVNTFARSAPNSLFCQAGVTDAVRPALGMTSGKWRMTAWQYIPSPLAGEVYFILNNVYNHGGPYQWTTELKCVNGFVSDDFRASKPQPLVIDQWAEYRIEIDLDANTVENYYNDCLISSGVYAVRGGPVEIQNIDLFSNGGACYWDDIVLEQIWTDNFDGYATNTVLDNVGGWSGWDNTPAAAGTAVDKVALSAPNSMFCTVGTDAVHPALGLTSGKWTLTAWQYIPTGGLTGGEVYLILNNVYNHGGPYQWTTELNCSNGVVTDDFRASTPQPLGFDRWIEFRVVIDLDANTVENYYHGRLISRGVYAVRGGAVEIQNIDLFSNGGTCYWDDIVLERTQPAIANTFGTGCQGTGGLVPVIGASGLPVSGSTTFSVDLSQARPSSPAVLLFSEDCDTVSFGSCTIYVLLPAAGIAVGTTGAGTVSVPLSIPAVVPLGLDAYMQFGVFDPNGAYANAVALSGGLRVQVGL